MNELQKARQAYEHWWDIAHEPEPGPVRDFCGNGHKNTSQHTEKMGSPGKDYQ